MVGPHNKPSSIPPSINPEREAFDKTVFATLNRQDGHIYCLECFPLEEQTDPCKVYGINIAPYSLVCYECKRLVIDGATRADGTPLTILE